MRLIGVPLRGVAALALVAATVLPTLTACRPLVPPPAGTSGAVTDEQLQLLVDDLVRCVRANGAPGMPDVRVIGGRVVAPDKAIADDLTGQRVRAALRVCTGANEALLRLTR